MRVIKTIEVRKLKYGCVVVAQNFLLNYSLFKITHYGLKLSVSKILNFPLESPSQIAPKFNSLVEQCRTKIQIQLEAGYG